MLEEIKGIGPKTLKALNALGIYNIDDLISYYPYKYNILKPCFLSEAQADEAILINGYVENPVKIFFIKKNLNKLMFKLNTNQELINVVIFNRAFLKSQLNHNKLISVIGKYNKKNNTFIASDIKLTPITEEVIEPKYHLSSAIKKSSFIKIINSCISNDLNIKNYIPDYLKEKYKFIDKDSAIRIMHNPKKLEDLRQAKLVLAYEELFVFMLKINYIKLYKTSKQKSNVKNFDKEKIDKFIKKLPFTLTTDQIKTIETIENDFRSDRRMNRLILGDVGSGKTICSFIALYMNYLAGYQGILMAPTEILAEQHFNNICNVFKDLGLKIALLTSSVNRAKRSEVLSKIKSNDVDILIGTHSVLNDEINFNKLGLVITDEQHRFGVNQRNNLANKGKMPDVIYMSATPIPRTLALTLYGDMDISQIKTKPNSRKEINTKLYSFKDINQVLSLMLEEIKSNHQIYVVAPLIDSEESNEMESVNKLYMELNTAFNSKVPIKILHGKLNQKDKNDIMSDYKNNKIKILISTTVIEVGIDIKNATMMVIFNAERFGLATLHQLRGRIGRNDILSKCLLISDYESERLKILEQSNDGFYISEKDFEMRGSGDLFGTRQSGDMSFKIANIKTNIKILQKCKEDSEEFLKNNYYNLNKYLNLKEIINSININS